MNIIPNKTYIVTGGSGFLGTKLIERIVREGGLVKTIARNEGNLLKLKVLFGDKVEIVCGDIAYPFSVENLMCTNFEGVFHLAAFKHVPLAETQSIECIRSNVYGSGNVLSVATEHKAGFVIGISTDKVAKVAGVYGASKLLMEKAFSQYESIYPDTQYRIVRYGNVLYSTGSVLCKWRDLIKQGKDVTISDPDATRFFWTIDQAIDLIFDCLENAVDSTPYVPEMKSMAMGDLLYAMIRKYAVSKIEMKVTGLQKGENKHEQIVENGLNSNETKKFTINEIMELI